MNDRERPTLTCTCVRNDPTVVKLMDWLVVYDDDGIPERMGDDAYDAGFTSDDVIRLQELLEGQIDWEHEDA